MIQVLHVLPRMPIGGVGTFLLNTEEFIDKKILNFGYLVIENHEQSSFVNKVEQHGSKLYLLDEKLALSNFKKIFCKIDEFFRIHNGEFDIVHLHSANVGMLVLPLAKKYGVEVRIIHSHSTKYSDSFFKSVRNYLIELPIFCFATHYLACSDMAGRFLFGKRKFYTVYNGIDSKRFLYQESYEKNNGKFVIGHIGNFLKVKNHDFIIEFFNKIYLKNNAIELWLIGSGPLENEIRRKVRKLGLEKCVKFLGRVNNVESLYFKMQAFVLPSLNEGFPVALMEAQASGLYCVVSDTITKEVDFYNDCKFLSVTDKNSVDLWVQGLLEVPQYDRLKKSLSFKDSIFDLEKTSKNLESLYIDFTKK